MRLDYIKKRKKLIEKNTKTISKKRIENGIRRTKRGGMRR
jgi:hypothetical protein